MNLIIFIGNMSEVTNNALLQTLSKVDARREKRQWAADLVIKNPEWLEPLIQIAIGNKNRVGDIAWWVLEIIYLKKPGMLLPFIDLFVEKADKINRESSLRPLSKILSFALEAGEISSLHYDRLTEICFSWLLGDHKVATKVHAMSSLYEIGRSVAWIHGDLVQIIEKHYMDESAAYKARAKSVLKSISRYQKDAGEKKFPG